MLHFHPHPEDLLDYAAGKMDHAFGVLIATHMTLCPYCRRTVADCEALGGAALETIEPVAVDAGCLDRLLARLDDPEEPEPEPVLPPMTGSSTHLPAPLRAFVGGAPQWKRVMKGLDEVEIGPLPRGVRARLMKIAPGCAMPRHTHGGREMLIVLDGGYSDEIGTYDVGDVAVADPEIVHKPVADAEEGCLCFAVTDAPLKLTGPIGRVLNLFIRY